VPEERLNEGIGMFGVTGLTGLAIGPVISEIIISQFGFSVFFLAATGMGAGTFFGSIILGYIGQWAGFQAVFFCSRPCSIDWLRSSEDSGKEQQARGSL